MIRAASGATYTMFAPTKVWRAVELSVELASSVTVAAAVASLTADSAATFR
jgi:hypothetical protein